MITLLTKVQYKDFEPGEFVEVQKRTYDETIKLIEEFPWNRQRDNIVVNHVGGGGTFKTFLQLLQTCKEQDSHYVKSEQHLLFWFV